MATENDLWYIRLPDGRVLRAKSTESLRRFLKSGKIPWDSRVRRSPEEAWQTLDKSVPFADLVPAGNAVDEELATPAISADAGIVKSRTAGPDLRALGMRGLVEELFNAFDSCLQKAKLTTTAFTGLGFGISLFVADQVVPILPSQFAWLGFAVVGLLVLLMFGVCTSILTRMTALELSRFQPAQFREIRSEVPSSTIRLTLALVLVGGPLAGLIIVLRNLPDWFGLGDSSVGLGPETIRNVLNGARVIVETICWPIFGFAMLLMGPTLMVEEYSVGRGLREWLGMLRQHVGRIYLYQSVAFAFAAMMTLPLLGPVLLAFGFAGGSARTLSLGESLTFYLLLGISLTPMLAYLLVAHVFIYLNLRYEFFYSAAKER